MFALTTPFLICLIHLLPLSRTSITCLLPEPESIQYIPDAACRNMFSAINLFECVRFDDVNDSDGLKTDRNMFPVMI